MASEVVDLMVFTSFVPDCCLDSQMYYKQVNKLFMSILKWGSSTSTVADKGPSENP